MPRATGKTLGRKSSYASTTVAILRRLDAAVTGALFLTMFFAIVIGVAARELLDAPVIWTVNVSTIAFIGAVMIGSGALPRDGGHVTFDLLYAKFSPTWKIMARLAGNAIIIVPFAAAVPGTIDYLQFQADAKVPGVGLNFGIAFLPFLLFLLITVVHRVALTVMDLKELRSGPEAKP